VLIILVGRNELLFQVSQLNREKNTNETVLRNNGNQETYLGSSYLSLK
jgi:hypothetical protein